MQKQKTGSATVTTLKIKGRYKPRDVGRLKKLEKEMDSFLESS